MKYKEFYIHFIAMHNNTNEYELIFLCISNVLYFF